MYGGDLLIGLARQDGNGINDFTTDRINPPGADASHGKDLARFHTYGVRLFSVARFSPLIKSLCWDKTSCLTHCVTKGGLLKDGLRTGIDQTLYRLLRFCPMRNEAPAAKTRYSHATLFLDNENFLRWTDVVARDIRNWRRVTKRLFQFFSRDAKGKTSTHG